MKKKNSPLIIALVALMMFLLQTGMLSYVLQINPFLFTGIVIVLAIACGRHKPDHSRITTSDGVYTEIWLGELVKRFRFSRSWLGLIPRYDQAVRNKVIHLVDVGADPTVYINLAIDKDNPVPIAHRSDADIPISLDKYDTQNTMVTLDELRAISYDKMAVTLDLHMNAIADKAAKRAAYRLAATQAANIKTTSGLADGRAVPKKMITPDDLVMMSETVYTPENEGGPEWPEGEGVAVLDFRHVADLQRKDQAFDKQWRNAQTGELFPYNGWKIFKFNQNAKYTKQLDGSFTLNAFGAVADPANDLHSSLFFLPQRAFAAADASPEMFYSIATTDPQFRANTVGFQHWNITAKKKADGFYQLISDKV